MSLDCFIKIIQSSFSKYLHYSITGGKNLKKELKVGKKIHIYLSLLCSVSKVTINPDLPGINLFYACCPSVIINSIVPFCSQKCCNLGSKLYGYPVCYVASTMFMMDP